MNKILLARLILYSGEGRWLTNTLDHSLKDGLFTSRHGELGIITIPSDELVEKLTQMNVLPLTTKYIVSDGDNKEPHLRGRWDGIHWNFTGTEDP